MIYHLQYSKQFEKQLKKMDRHEAQKIYNWLRENIEGCNNPRLHGKALKGNLGGLWRYRIENYRVIAEINDSVLNVLAVKVDHRKQVYK